MNGRGWVPIKLYLQTQVAGRIWLGVVGVPTLQMGKLMLGMLKQLSRGTRPRSGAQILGLHFGASESVDSEHLEGTWTFSKSVNFR